MSADAVLSMIKDNEVKFVDLRFADTIGKEQHVTVPASQIDADFLEDGKMFDGSSIAGWKGINESDMVLMPDHSTCVLDPFTEETTMNLRCDVLEPSTMQGYERCPRSVAKRAEAYLASTGIADSAIFGPEPEFFVFDDVRWGADMQGAFYKVDSEEADWNTEKVYEDGNMDTGLASKAAISPFPQWIPCTTSRLHVHGDGRDGSDCRSAPPRVATAASAIGTGPASLVRKADELLILKYCVHNVAAFGKSATFMPKPLVGDNGSGMHVHQSLGKAGTNIMAGDMYAGLSQEALWYIGGIFKHARAINAFTNSGTNSYKRLVPGFEAPTLLAYSARNRSASIRIPHVSSPKARRIEVRFPDSNGNPYYTFAAMMMAGLDGIKNQIDPGSPIDKDLYDLPPEEEGNIATVCSSLDQALDALDKDREFLLAGDVFTNDAIDAYINLKMEEVTRFRMTTHPVEFDMYYSL